MTISATSRDPSVAKLSVLAGYPSRVDFRDEHRNRLHRHSFFEPSLVVGGRGEFLHGGQRMALRPGDLFLADIGVGHEITSLRTRDLELVYTTFVIAHGPSATPSHPTEDSILHAFLAAHSNHVRGQQAVGRLFEAVVAQRRDESAPMRGVFASELMRLLVLNIIARLTTEPAADTAGGIGSAHIARAFDIIDARMAEPLSVRGVAQAVGISERSLSRVFTKELGHSVGREIQLRRIRRAAALLAMPEISVAAAGRQVGIDDPAQFSRLFRRVVGISPRAYRYRHPVHVVHPTPLGIDVLPQTEFL